MKLATLLKFLPDSTFYGTTDVDVSSIAMDSRVAIKATLFVAIKGLTLDGHDFISEACVKGARVVVGEKDKSKLKIPKGVTYVKVENSRKALGLLASAFYGNPSEKLVVIGVTGTDGKTTTASLIYHVLRLAGKKAGLITTVSAKVGKKEVDTGLHVTNPDPLSLQRILSDMVKGKCEFAVVEVTSHGLDQERVAGVTFNSAVLTNITHEHLDYHKSFEDYRDTKTKLFQLAKNFVVLNKDDESFDYISKSAQSRIISYSIKDRIADTYGTNIREEGDKTFFELIRGVNSYTIQSTLPGDYNVTNSLAAIATVLEYGVTLESIKKALLSFKAPKGRLEEVKNEKGFKIYIDFAHTPNALKQVLALLRKRVDQRKGKLISVFGCAGERDIKKRPLMGKYQLG